MIKKAKFKEVIWMDAADHSDVSLLDVEYKEASEYLVKRTTYGKLIKETENTIILVRDIDEDGNCEITAIPKMWVVENERSE